MTPHFLPLFFISTFAWAISENANFLVHLPNGAVQGRLVKSPNGAEGMAFLGIPYVEPPINNLRFRNPQPMSNWSGVLECFQYKQPCWQVHRTLDNLNITGTEDCLYLNIFTGHSCFGTKEKCPVVYYIHGGKLDFDSPALFSPVMLIENFASQGVVLVTIQYRLNIFGFWSTGNEEAEGNYGVHDMIAGLEWVQKNIHHFGGDPSQVTIMGQSAGGGAVSFLTLSPKTVGLFNRAIMMSGVSASFGFENRLDIYWEVAENVGCTGDKMVVDCMRRVPEDVLGNAYARLQVNYDLMTRIRNDGAQGLFPAPLDQLLLNRRPINALMGTAIREFGYTPRPNERVNTSTIFKVCKYVTRRSHWKNEELVLNACQKHYSKPDPGKTLDPDILVQRAAQVTDALYFYAPCYKEADSLRSNGATVYVYSFEYSKNDTTPTPFHSFDLAYVLGLRPFEFDDRDKRIRQIYVPLFVNFAKFGTPTPSERADASRWMPLKEPNDFNYYSIDLPKATMKSPYYYDVSRIAQSTLRDAIPFQDVIFWNHIIPALDNAISDPANRIPAESGHVAWHSVLIVVSITLIIIGSIFAIRKIHRRQAEDNHLLLHDNKRYGTNQYIDQTTK